MGQNIPVKRIERTPLTEAHQGGEIRASERNPALKREEMVGRVLAHFNFQDTTEDYKANLAVLKGLRMNGLDTTPLIEVIETYGILSADRGGAGRIMARDILAPPKVYIPGLGIPNEDEQPGFFSRIFGGIWGMTPWGKKE